MFSCYLTRGEGIQLASDCLNLTCLLQFFEGDQKMKRYLRDTSISLRKRIARGNAIRFSVIERGNRKANEKFVEKTKSELF
jgi:hypothetical protein